MTTLTAFTVPVALVGAGRGEPSSVVGPVVAAVLAGGVLLDSGRAPFLAAMLIALTDVALLVVGS
jgi:hypothetical protein